MQKFKVLSAYTDIEYASYYDDGSYYHSTTAATLKEIDGTFIYQWKDIYSNNYQIAASEINEPHYDAKTGTLYIFSNSDYPETYSKELRAELKSIIIANGVTEIKNAAFKKLSGLEYVKISDTVISIGDESFFECSSLTEILIPDSVKTIGKSAFEDCKKLYSISVGQGVESIGYQCFTGCTSLNEVYIKDISAWLSIKFDRTRANPLYYAKEAYVSGILLDNLIIPENITSVNEYAFYGYDGLLSVTINDMVTTIGNHAFEECEFLNEVNMGHNVSIIGQEAFRGCSRLANIYIPDSVTNIMNCAFYGCESLSSITIPSSVTYIGNGTFLHCDSLASIYFEAPSGWWIAKHYLATSGTDIPESELSSPKHAAELFTDTTLYSFYNWKRN